MHEKIELDENLRQYCIEKDQKDKYAAYLNCFVTSASGDAAGCLVLAKIDTAKLNSCVTSTDAEYSVTAGYNDKSTWVSGQFPKFSVESDLNTKYGVQGSPTIIINDALVEVATRSPESFKQTVCQAFNNPPAECSQALSGDVVSAGFGAGTTGASDSAAGCAQ